MQCINYILVQQLSAFVCKGSSFHAQLTWPVQRKICFIFQYIFKINVIHAPLRALKHYEHYNICETLFMICFKVKTGHPLCLPWPQMKRRRRRTRHSPPLPFLKQLIPGHMSSECRFRDFHPRVAFILTSTIISPLPRCQSQVQQGCSGSFHPFRLKNEFTGFQQSASSAAILVFHVLQNPKSQKPPRLRSFPPGSRGDTGTPRGPSEPRMKCTGPTHTVQRPPKFLY